MSEIPLKIKNQISNDPFYETCIHERYRGLKKPNERITMEHAWIYAGRQIQDAWAIVPCKESFNIGVTGDNKDFNRFISLMRADIEKVVGKYPKKDWRGERRRLMGKFKKYEKRLEFFKKID